MKLPNQIQESAQFIKKFISEYNPEMAVILGSGLGVWADALDIVKAINVSKIPHWPVPTVKGHRGRLLLCRFDECQILILQGRVHLYEGYSIQQTAFPVRVLGALGINSLIVTNAAGGLNPELAPGDLMLITDHINFMGSNPLIGSHHLFKGNPFPDMSEPYDIEYIALTEAVARELNIPLKKGILLACTGPSYETASEVSMMRLLGADAVCMSTIPEVIVGVQLGLRILGLSTITNLGTGLSQTRLSHDDIGKAVRQNKEKFSSLMKGIIAKILRDSIS